jgi:DNA-binding response OmpR family regulator
VSASPEQRSAEPLSGWILVVEDDPNVRGALVDCLEVLGLRVTAAEDGDAALRRIREGSFDLILLDLQLPVRSGLEVLAWMRADGRTEPVVVLTGNRDLETAKASMRLGARDYLPKPFEVDQLHRIVRWHLAGRARRDSTLR